jgi:hypothetical protein
MASSVVKPNPFTRDLKWSGTEKMIAKRAFDLALQREFDAVIRNTKKMASKIEKNTDLWKLESYLTRSRRKIDRQFDWRYSVLPEVFAGLIRKGLLREEDLQGLGDDKLKYIRLYL